MAVTRRKRRHVKSQWKMSETPARARMKLLHRDACDHAGVPMLCECHGALDAWDLLRELERPKTVLCCRKPSFPNSAETTARIFRAELICPEQAEEA